MWPFAGPTNTDAQHPIRQVQSFLGLKGAQDQGRACKGNQQPSGTHDPRHYLLGGLVGGGVLLSCRFLQRYRKRRSADQQERNLIQAALHAEARAQAALAAQSRQDQFGTRTHSRHGITSAQGSSAATGPNTESSNQAETSRQTDRQPDRQPKAAARQANQGSKTSRARRPIRAPAFLSDPGGSAATEAYDIYNPPQYRPDPDAARPEERRLSAWEDARVKDPGMESRLARAHLDTGNAACTLITTEFARQLGLLNEDDVPTQAHGGTVRTQGVVPGATVDLPVINIEYQIKGKRIYSRAGLSDQGAQCQWDLLISLKEVQLFEADGFTFSTRT